MSAHGEFPIPLLGYRAISHLIETIGALHTCGINVHKSNGMNLTFCCSSAVR